MLIDWFTVAAQALNFLVLVWLLKRFLYKPILTAIDSREKKIAAELSKAQANMSESQKEKEEYQSKNKQLEETRATLLKKAQDDAKAEYDKLMVNAQKAADDCSAKRQEGLDAELVALNVSVSGLIQKQVFTIARKAFRELSTSSLEENICGVFLQRLDHMDEKSKTTLIDAINSAPASVVLRSAFAMEDSRRQSIQDALNKLCNRDMGIKFEISAELLAGVELQANGQSIGWNIDDYLVSLQKNLRQLIHSQDVAAAEELPSKNPVVEKTVVAK
jgi:F-type H+-transporting ATPase subunit b